MNGINFQKYIKYKAKYLNLIKLKGGSNILSSLKQKLTANNTDLKFIFENIKIRLQQVEEDRQIINEEITSKNNEIIKLELSGKSSTNQLKQEQAELREKLNEMTVERDRLQTHLNKSINSSTDSTSNPSEDSSTDSSTDSTQPPQASPTPPISSTSPFPIPPTSSPTPPSHLPSLSAPIDSPSPPQISASVPPLTSPTSPTSPTSSSTSIDPTIGCPSYSINLEDIKNSDKSICEKPDSKNWNMNLHPDKNIECTVDAELKFKTYQEFCAEEKTKLYTIIDYNNTLEDIINTFNEIIDITLKVIPQIKYSQMNRLYLSVKASVIDLDKITTEIKHSINLIPLLQTLYYLIQQLIINQTTSYIIKNPLPIDANPIITDINNEIQKMNLTDPLIFIKLIPTPPPTSPPTHPPTPPPNPQPTPPPNPLIIPLPDTQTSSSTTLPTSPPTPPPTPPSTSLPTPPPTPSPTPPSTPHSTPPPTPSSTTLKNIFAVNATP